MSSLCQYCFSEVFEPAGWRRLWASKLIVDNLAMLTFERSYAELLHSAEFQCWFCRWILNRIRSEEVDFNGLVAIGKDYSYKIDLYPHNPGKLYPRKICLLRVYGSFYTSNAKDRASMVLSSGPAKDFFGMYVGATTTPGKPNAASFRYRLKLFPPKIMLQQQNFSPAYP
jgi:hypothetical protein